MPTIGSVTKTIRFNPSDLGIIEDIMKKEDTTFNNAVHLLIENGVHPKNQPKSVGGTPENEEKCVHPKTDNEAIEEMAGLMRVTTEKLYADIKDLLERGDVGYVKGELTITRYEEFENFCAASKQQPEKLLERVMRSM